ncbi:uncharacterized protein LOC126968598 [Leptidea sinapis]|uniref:uncharacterized protein LOC126968598 n=1 Tax=Leptidea sinapis TaxID=189913 RepID=UPI0021C2E0FD|nr:uncharacterized protein LOC126968598 [Leptidea sinapis]
MLRHDDEEAGAYTLYLEHLGGLVPLLKGRRTSKIRPEFVIFDPQAEEGANVPAPATRESSSSSAGSSSSSSGGRGYSSPRTPRHNRAPPSPRDRSVPPHDDSCSSDTEREEAGCSGSPRLQRRRRARERRKARTSTDKEDMPNQLAYIDSLPEDVRLVEVTSNIWGTKFKMHGLAKNVPDNLGQVTYKTSLLHLQPRQMTLTITELRDDYPVRPDPNFNPNIFSEDEEDVFHPSDNNSPTHTNNNIRMKFNPNILSERINNTINIGNQCDTTNNNINNTNPSIARTNSYEEFPFIDTNELNNLTDNIYNSSPVRHTSQSSDRRINNTANVPNRHAISPLRCESSVPTLQSPKNAVAPTDIIFERPSPQAVTCGGRGDFCVGRTDYSVRSDNVSLKGNLSNNEHQSFNLNLSLEPSRQVTIKKCDNHVADNCLSKLRKNICNRGESSYDINTRILKSFCNKSFEHEVHPDAMSKKTDTLKNLQKSEDLKFIDEETPAESISNIIDKPREIRVQRTTTVVPISPVCANIPMYDTMTRSCSVGYLDLVDPQVLHAHVSLSALRGEPPRRLVLVNNKRQRRPKKYFKTDLKTAEVKTPLRKCGKSRSLDSSELSITADKVKKQSKTDLNKGEEINSSMGEDNSGTSAEESGKSVTVGRRSRRDYPVCTVCRLVSPYDRREVHADSYVCVACSTRITTSAPAQPQYTDSDTDYSKYYRSLEQLALRLLATRGNKKSSNNSIVRESSSAPASPRPARSAPRPAPASPAPTPRRHRYSSASPIRQLLNSPLLNRRRNKKPSESSDDEYPSGYSEINSKNYRDLESFQKAQLRNKLKRGGMNITCGTDKRSSRRQLVMHNKAPMWNENSQVYQLDFGGRVTQESAKNFQIEYHGKQVMQFGRIDGNAYTLDFQYPFSALQAFAVALANVTQRLK